MVDRRYVGCINNTHYCADEIFIWSIICVIIFSIIAVLCTTDLVQISCVILWIAGGEFVPSFVISLKKYMFFNILQAFNVATYYILSLFFNILQALYVATYCILSLLLNILQAFPLQTNFCQFLHGWKLRVSRIHRWYYFLYICTKTRDIIQQSYIIHSFNFHYILRRSIWKKCTLENSRSASFTKRYLTVYHKKSENDDTCFCSASPQTPKGPSL